MTSISWWRSWHGAPTDLKWAVIAQKANVKVGIVSAVAWALFDYASQNKDRGTVAGFDTETYAVYSGFDESEVIAVINAMTDKGVITDGRLTSWEKRQPKREDNTVTQRVRQWREVKRNVTQETQCNTPDTDTDTDKDTEEEPARGEPPNVYRLYENNIGVLTPIVADKLSLAEKEYPEPWFEKAIAIAVENNARNWGYVHAILERWKTQGFQDDGKKPKARSPTVSEPAGFATLRKAAERLAGNG